MEARRERDGGELQASWRRDADVHEGTLKLKKEFLQRRAA